MDGLFGFVAVISLVGWILTRYSIWCLPLVVSVAILAEDDFYPLSDFPMYSDPDESENFLYVATWEDDPARVEAIPIHQFTALSAPKVKKMEQSYTKDFAKEKGKKDTELTREELAESGGILLDRFREIATTRNTPLPDRLALVEVWIVASDDGGWTETPTVVAAQTGAGQTLPPVESAPISPTTP